jgi:hypothetical protein
MAFKDGAVNAGGKSEIICIDDEAAHRVSLAGQSLYRRRFAEGELLLRLVTILHHSAEPMRLTDFFPLAYTH